jgi:hypothetical protein
MKLFFKSTAVTLLLMSGFSQTLLAGVRANGVGVRGIYWGTDNQTTHIRVYNYHDYHDVSTEGFGGSIYFFTRLDSQYYLEFSVGAVGNVESKRVYFNREEVYVNSATTMLFGVRYDVFKSAKTIAAQPYVSAGFGPYWLGEIEVKNNDRLGEEEATIRTRVKPGVYAGVGTHFLFCDWCGLNMDIKYHLVNFDVTMPYSDFAFGMGFMFTWN